jgi:hypothetical protein
LLGSAAHTSKPPPAAGPVRSSPPSSRRISASASRAEPRIARSGGPAGVGSRANAASAASDWIAITLTPCATTRTSATSTASA